MIQRLLTLFFLASLQVFAAQYDNTILDIEAKLFPKIAVLEKGVQEDTSPHLKLVILSQEMDLNIAESLKKKIRGSYPDTLAGKKIEISIKTDPSKISIQTHAIITLYQSKKTLIQLSAWANTHKILSFSYDPADLEYGILASIHIGLSTKPYLNDTVIRENNFIFNSYLLQLSKFYK